MIFFGFATHVCFHVICELSLILNYYSSWNRQDRLEVNAHTAAVCKYLILGSTSIVEDLVRQCETNQSMVCAYFCFDGRNHNPSQVLVVISSSSSPPHIEVFLPC